MNSNSKYSFNKSTTEGDKVQGFNSQGNLVDLDVAGSTESYELTITSKKNTRNINEIVMNSEYITKASFNVPWTETQTVASGAVTLANGTPVASEIYVSYLDGTKLTSTGGTPTAGQFKDNADGTLSFNAADNSKTVAIMYKITQSNILYQGGVDYASLGYLDVMFHMVSGTSSDSTKKGVDVLWLPKCSLSGDSTFDFDNTVQDKSFKLTAVIPDTPSGLLVPYAWMRDLELKNTNAG